MRSERQSFATVLITTFLRWGAPFVSLAIVAFLAVLLSQVDFLYLSESMSFVIGAGVFTYYIVNVYQTRISSGSITNTEMAGFTSAIQSIEQDNSKQKYDDKIKRAFDMIISIAIIVVYLPIIVSVCAVILVFNGKPIVVRSRRIGKGGKYIDVLKFRTMVPDAEDVLQRHLSINPKALDEWKRTRRLEKDPRLTRIGKILRKSSIDEMPQLVNVIMGDMSLVGPRPVVPSEIILYGPYADNYKSVKPGLTGAWQVSGRSDISYSSRIRLDIYYVKHRSFLMDLKLILMTIPAVLKSKGSY